MRRQVDCYLCACCGNAFPANGSISGSELELSTRGEDAARVKCLEGGLLLCDDCNQVIVVALAEKGRADGLEIVFH